MIEAVADFDGVAAADAGPAVVTDMPASNADAANDQPAAEPVAILHAPEPLAPTALPQEAVAAEPSADTEKSVRRRSTVREKVSFASSDAPAAPELTEAPQAVPAPAEEPAPPAPEPVAEASSAAPRRAGWWSRRFGGGD